MKKRVALIGLLSVLLSACGSSQEDDLDQFMHESGRDARFKIKPLPEVQRFSATPFNKDGALNDPFRPRKAFVAKEAGLQPDLDRPREPLESFPLESLKFTGLLEKPEKRYALIKAPDNTVHQVAVGNYLGQNMGMVVKLSDHEMELREIVHDDLSGEWVERKTSVTLQE